MPNLAHPPEFNAVYQQEMREKGAARKGGGDLKRIEQEEKGGGEKGSAEVEKSR